VKQSVKRLAQFWRLPDARLKFGNKLKDVVADVTDCRLQYKCNNGKFLKRCYITSMGSATGACTKRRTKMFRVGSVILIVDCGHGCRSRRMMIHLITAGRCSKKKNKCTEYEPKILHVTKVQ
jgi:hypothetical protein